MKRSWHKKRRELPNSCLPAWRLLALPVQKDKQRSKAHAREIYSITPKPNTGVEVEKQSTYADTSTVALSSFVLEILREFPGRR